MLCVLCAQWGISCHLNKSSVRRAQKTLLDPVKGRHRRSLDSESQWNKGFFLFSNSSQHSTEAHTGQTLWSMNTHCCVPSFLPSGAVSMFDVRVRSYYSLKWRWQVSCVCFYVFEQIYFPSLQDPRWMCPQIHLQLFYIVKWIENMEKSNSGKKRKSN